MRALPFLIATVVYVVTARWGFAQDAHDLYEQACNGGDLIACNVFGLMYETGRGVPQNFERARALYLRACEGGQLSGCTNLGLLYEHGVGVERDFARARGLYLVACEGSDVLGCDLVRLLNENADARVPETFVKAGTVTDATTGRGLSEAIVILPDLGFRSVTNAAGEASLRDVSAGRHAMRVEALGYAPMQGTLEVPGSGDFLVVLRRIEVDDSLATGRVSGQVTGSGTGGLADVEVLVASHNRRTLTGPSGYFALEGLSPGLIEVRLTRLGYAPRTVALIVHPGATHEISAVMSVEAVELQPIRVEVAGRAAFLQRNGFYLRQDRGLGHQFTESELDRLDPTEVSDVVRRVPGVRLRIVGRGQVGSRWYAVNDRAQSLTRGPCVLPVYVDGVLSADAHLDQVPEHMVAALEVYSGLDAPVEFQGDNACGVVLIWTKR